METSLKERNHQYYIANRDKITKQNRQYAIAHADKTKEYKHAWYLSHREVYIEKAKTWTFNNREKSREIKSKWRLLHPEKNKEIQHNYFEANMEKFRAELRNRRAAKLLALGDGVTVEQEEQLKEEYDYRCAYCGEQKPLALDHVVPLSRGGAHDISNVVPACKSCNSRKSARSLLMWMYIKSQDGNNSAKQGDIFR